MGGKTHMSFGALSFILLAGPIASATSIIEVSFPWTIIGIFIGAIAGLLPDIDEPNSKLGRGGWMSSKLGPIFKLLAVIISLPIRLVGYLIKGVLGHRGGTHSLAMSFVFTLCLAIPLTILFGGQADWVIWAIWAGYVSHLMADMLNPSGVPLLWPLFSKHRKYHLLPSAIRIPTKTPPDPRELMIRLLVNIAIVVLTIIFFIIPVL